MDPILLERALGKKKMKRLQLAASTFLSRSGPIEGWNGGVRFDAITLETSTGVIEVYEGVF